MQALKLYNVYNAVCSSSNLPTLDHATFDINDDSESAMYTCDEGYELVDGNGIVNCRGGRWTTVSFYCEVIG